MMRFTQLACWAGLGFLLCAGPSPVRAQSDLHPPCCEISSCSDTDCENFEGSNGCDALGMGACSTNCCPTSIWNRPQLTGDWFGLRPQLQQSGIVFRGSSTHFGFGTVGGIERQAAAVLPIPLEPGDAFEYTGRGEYDFIVDLEKFGGLKAGKFLIGMQHWYGEYANVSNNTGTFAPPVFAATLPPSINDPGVPYVTDFLITQPLSERTIVYAGKKNVVGTADQDVFAGGDGTNQFVNQALVANPAYLLGLPYSSFSAGIVFPREWGSWNAYVYDPQDRTRDFFKLNDLFSEGIIVGTQLKVNTNFFRKPGEHHIGGIWKHVELNDLSFESVAPAYPYPPPKNPNFRTIEDSYTIYYGFDQYFGVFPGERPSASPRKNPRGWGMFGRASISDGNPTPLRYFLSLGLGGDSRLGCDRGDTWGLGWFYSGTSKQFGPLPNAVLGPRDGMGVELFYNVQVTPWLNLTPDVQYLRPSLGNLTNGKDVFVYGIRANMKL